jgi:nucleoside phosphorylase
VDVVLLCALEEEATAVLRHFPDRRESRLGPYRCYHASLLPSASSEAALRVAIVELREKGNLASTQASTLAIQVFQPRAVILFGICGGIIKGAEDFRLGDVVVGNEIVYYEPGKTTPGGHQDRAQHFKAVDAGPNSLLAAALSLQDTGWTAIRQINEPRPNDERGRTRPQIKSGLICSGEKVIADSGAAANLQQAYSAISIEMEAAGVAYACQHTLTPFLVVKAVSDYADVLKDDSHHAYACATSAAFAVTLLREGPVPARSGGHLPRLALAVLFQLVPDTESEIVLPGYSNPRHRDSGFANYPFNQFESAFDDVLCALKILPSVEEASGRGNVHFVFSLDNGVGRRPNTILIGSSFSNPLTRHVLEECYYRFATDGHVDGHAIVDATGRFCFNAETQTRTDGQKEFVKDYALVTVLRGHAQCTVVLAGCRAYGQAIVGECLTRPEIVERLSRVTQDQDFQAIVETSIVGRRYTYNGVRALVTRHRNQGWKQHDVSNL